MDEFTKAAKEMERLASQYKAFADHLARHPGDENSKKLATHFAIVTAARVRKSAEEYLDVAECFSKHSDILREKQPNLYELREQIEQAAKHHDIPTNPNELPK